MVYCGGMTRLIVATLVALLLATQASAAPFPARPLRLITAGTPGSPPDSLARILAEPLGAALGQPVIVDNRPGGSGTIAVSAVAQSPRDGHTIGTIGLPQLVAPALLTRMPYDSERDLAPVTQVAWTGSVLVVRAGSPLHSLSDVIALAKAEPDRLTYASAGNGAPGHLAGELFRLQSAIGLRHIPYKGIAQGLNALLGEQVDSAFAGVAAAAPLVRSGKLRALATSSPRRLPALPGVPTIAELGLSGYAVDEWYGIVAPAGTPPDAIVVLAREIARAIALPQTRERLQHLGLYPADTPGPDAMAARVRSELPRWYQLVREAGIRPD
jgi:tripartite-type tricarboxylate transporter receptor subunit TctC